MNEVNALTSEVADALSSEVDELDNPILAQAVAASAATVVPRAIAEASESATDEWESLPFPGAVVDVNQLPEGASIDIVTSLEQQNTTLRDRVACLEGSLDKAQTNLCHEVARWEALALAGDERLAEQAKTQEATIANYVEELTATQQQVTELFAKLELAHQSAQRQYIVMETLNTQLRNSQERVAQLERECAGVHQQNVDQAQQVLQQEHQIRDLQARLQRQQRYTLQYKAALEKSLEVSQKPTEPTLLADREASQLAAKSVSMPKPSPVQPWSGADAAAESEEYSRKAWLNSFLSESGMFPMEDVLANFNWQPSEETTTDVPVSFDLDDTSEHESIGLNLEQFKVDSHAPVNALGESSASPFITLQETEAEAVESDAGESMPKLESLAAVDLPMFSKADAAAVALGSSESAER